MLFRSAVAGDLDTLRRIADSLPADRAGIRLHGVAALAPLLAVDGAIGSVAGLALGASAMPVRAILFDKTAATNWSLGWHQDRTICVRQRHPVAGFGPWTVKQGLLHVAPPFEILARMVAVRVNLDDVPRDNAPLLIAPGSHLDGRIAVERVQGVVDRRGLKVCLAAAGDIWLYATPVLHASEASSGTRRRRVIQVDYTAERLPGGLELLGV